MALKLFNTLSRSVQEFVPLDPAGQHVGLYCCGPTVYDFAHIGNWRTFVFADLVRRYLEFKGYAVRHVMNITDVEDKIIRRVNETRNAERGTQNPELAASTVQRFDHLTPLRQFTAKFEAAFLEDLKTLNCLAPHHTPRATEHIPEIIALIGQLMARGLAYQAPDGSIYFSIEKYRGCGCCYGQLVKLNFDEMRVGERVQSDEYAKDALADFALWKARVPEDGDVFWSSPWGEGRPGWHIECSAMSMKVLGPSFDLHLGGEDLMFPHHEDEIAQSEGAGAQPAGQRFVKYWLHGAFLLVEGRKMSKSLGNFFTLRDLLAKGFSGREIRYLLLTAHYRETFNFTLEGLQGARSALARIDDCVTKLRERAADVPSAGQNENAAPGADQSCRQDAGSTLVERAFAEALDDDLNISAAWGAVFDWVRETNRQLAENKLTPAQAAQALNVWQRADAVLGVAAATQTDVPPEISALLEQRQAARKAKDFKRADEVRAELKAKGWLIEDTPKGARLKRV